MALDTVADYIADTRVLLQDIISPYRYADAELMVAFNTSLLDALRLRSDLFLGDGTTTAFNDPTPYPAVNTDPVAMEFSFRPAIVYGTAAHAMMRDQEDVQDQRAQAFMAIFTQKLTGDKV